MSLLKAFLALLLVFGLLFTPAYANDLYVVGGGGGAIGDSLPIGNKGNNGSDGGVGGVGVSTCLGATAADGGAGGVAGDNGNPGGRSLAGSGGGAGT